MGITAFPKIQPALEARLFGSPQLSGQEQISKSKSLTAKANQLNVSAILLPSSEYTNLVWSLFISFLFAILRFAEDFLISAVNAQYNNNIDQKKPASTILFIRNLEIKYREVVCALACAH